MTRAARCESVYQNVNQKGDPLGTPLRCTLPADLEHETHLNLTPGRRTKWPTSAEQTREAKSDA